jgi:hypothetical protein
MKLGKTLSELATTLERNAEAKRDYVADTRDLVMTPEESNLIIANSDEWIDGGEELKPTDHCHNQIASYTGIGTRYYRKMRDESPSLLAGNVNHWFNKKPEKGDNRRMVRTMYDTARAFLSDSYLRVDNEHIAEVALTAFQDIPDLSVVSCDVTDKKLYIKAVFPRTEREVKVGDAVQSGVVVSNGEIGNGYSRVDPFWLRLWCLNGCSSMVRENGYRKMHRGSKIENDGVVYQQDTVDAVAKATLMQIRDAVTTFADPKWFETFVAKLKESAETDAIKKPVEAVQLLSKTLGFSKDENDSILERLIRGEDYTKYGMLNAVTNLANDVDSYDRATELEFAGGQILDLPQSQWTQIAEAA